MRKATDATINLCRVGEIQCGIGMRQLTVRVNTEVI